MKKAVALGYRVEKIYEVWHFNETLTYDREKKVDGLFSDYINTFLKLKQEASGWPSSCIPTDGQTINSPEIQGARRGYVESYFKHKDKQRLGGCFISMLKLIIWEIRAEE